MIEKFNKLDNSKKISIVVGFSLVLIILIIVYAINRNDGVNFDVTKEYSDKELVYTDDTIEIDELFHIDVPHINIQGSFIKNINEDIKSYIDDYTSKTMVLVSYEYNVNGEVLSLVIKAVDYGNEDTGPIAYFKTYNINLETNELVGDEELLNLYGTTLADVSSAIEKQFKYWYEDLANQGYLEEECDYECFLEYREVEDYTEDISYYIEKGKLIVFKPFIVYSIYGEEDYFKESDFKFTIE